MPPLGGPLTSQHLFSHQRRKSKQFSISFFWMFLICLIPMLSIILFLSYLFCYFSTLRCRRYSVRWLWRAENLSILSFLVQKLRTSWWTRYYTIRNPLSWCVIHAHKTIPMQRWIVVVRNNISTWFDHFDEFLISSADSLQVSAVGITHLYFWASQRRRCCEIELFPRRYKHWMIFSQNSNIVI